MLPIFLQLALFLFIFALWLYSCLVRRANFFRSRGIPGPKAALLSGNLGAMFGQNLLVHQLPKWTEQFGSVYGVLQGWVPTLVVADPEVAHELLVTKFKHFHGRNLNAMFGDAEHGAKVDLFVAQGARWKRLRSTANSAFSTANLRTVMALVDDSIRHALDFLEQAQLGGGPINLHRYFVEMTFDVIARVALGQTESLQFRSAMAQSAVAGSLRVQNSWWDWYSWLAPPLGHRVLKPLSELTGLWRKEPLELLFEGTFQAVLKRKQQRQEDAKRGIVEYTSNDFIDLFLDVEASSDRLAAQQVDGVYDAKAQHVEKKNSLEELVAQCVLFLVAGFDTTANTLSIVCHFLALHPHVQHKLWREIEDVCLDETPTYEQLGQLKYAEAVVKESLRLHPIASFVTSRICAETTTLGDVTVEKGTGVQPDVFSIHRNKRVWGEDAEQFRPERWLNEEGRLIQHQHFYAFGAGPRICLGMRFALLEEKMALTRILRKFTILRLPQTESELSFHSQIVLNTNAVTVGLMPRERQ